MMELESTRVMGLGDDDGGNELDDSSALFIVEARHTTVSLRSASSTLRVCCSPTRPVSTAMRSNERG